MLAMEGVRGVPTTLQLPATFVGGGRTMAGGPSLRRSFQSVGESI